MPTASNLDLVQAHCRLHDIPWPVPEYRFHPARRWRLDFAWPDLQIAVEVQGGIWTGGRHATGRGLLADYDKLSTAAVMGWCVILVTPSQIRSKQWLRYFTDACGRLAGLNGADSETRLTLPDHCRDYGDDPR
jgi:hypothetical protein